MLPGALILIGICGVLCRRNILNIALCFHLVILGIILLVPQSMALILLMVFSLQILVCCGVSIFVYRHIGTLNVDEFRQTHG